MGDEIPQTRCVQDFEHRVTILDVQIAKGRHVARTRVKKTQFC